MLNNKTVLITGGTGSFGQEFVYQTIKKFPKIKKLIIFSRDELKQYEMEKKFPIKQYPFLRYFLGDIRDKSRLVRAMENVDIVIHAAALKQVPAAEYNPFEFIKTNIIGAQNIIEASLEKNVQKIIALSTDKAASPINLYGATKLCSDKLFIAANNIVGKNNQKFSVVRYGNVMKSRGSVIPHFIEQKKSGVITITDKNMTRFNILLSEGVEMVFWSLKNLIGGEIFVPKIPSYKIMDLANAISLKSEKKIIGIRPGEKIHEELISQSDSAHTIDLGKYYAILSPSGNMKINDYIKRKGGKKVPFEFSYTSGNNKKFLTIRELNKLLK